MAKSGEVDVYICGSDRLNKFAGNHRAAVDFAIAAAALKSSIPGDTNFVTEAEILSLMNGNTHGRISR